jgi:hypothetical protein
MIDSSCPREPSTAPFLQVRSRNTAVALSRLKCGRLRAAQANPRLNWRHSGAQLAAGTDGDVNCERTVDVVLWKGAAGLERANRGARHHARNNGRWAWKESIGSKTCASESPLPPPTPAAPMRTRHYVQVALREEGGGEAHGPRPRRRDRVARGGRVGVHERRRLRRVARRGAVGRQVAVLKVLQQAGPDTGGGVMTE